MPELLWTGPADGPVLVLAHGAGAAMDSDWMNRMAALLADRGIRVARFEFAYMAARRGPDGRRKPPPKAETLMDEYRAAVAAVLSTEPASRPVLIGGKSMGGRVASLVADELRAAGEVRGLVCLGYPFHPPGRPERLRTAHLLSLATPTLVCQGTRDPFGTVEEVPAYGLPASIRFVWLEDGEHEFKPRAKLSGHTHAEHLATAADAVADFARTVGYDGTGESQGDVA
ncbi:alpha/beta family hydrolase [Herbiconiux sp. VKM Ac-2851]|uniref:alpha/beta family hydrolase n=1 Tax=Herbiconiux sp. VKM Ac-2851 TaxID=2739025 RepID=UPI00156453A9|nr:alpha/beta family hydrolase [Herbiconiux sp. VKM Ac-2851]NQX34575.1 alpha/beta hydrolase [Herbiconiux sp. VKM Ac-2851]